MVPEKLYHPFYAGETAAFRDKVERYLILKQYHTSFGDILPLVASKALNLQPIICSSTRTLLHDF